jgi:hypothetical protein
MAANNGDEQHGNNCHHCEQSLDEFQAGSPNIEA